MEKHERRQLVGPGASSNSAASPPSVDSARPGRSPTGLQRPDRDRHVHQRAQPVLVVTELVAPQPLALVVVAQRRGDVDVDRSVTGRRKLAELLRAGADQPSRHTARTVATDATDSATAQ